MKASKIRLMELAGLREVDDIAGTYGKLNYGDFEFIKVTQQVWDKLTDIEQANAVLSAIDDTDEAEGYIGAEWDELPSVATANMRIAIKKGTSINEAVDPKNWPIGFFEVKNTFQITPGGGWTVTFTQGQLLQVAVSKIDQSVQTITRYNALKGQWDVVAPPISGYKDNGGMFPIAAFGGSQSWTAKFDQNTVPMSKGQADSKANSMAKETTLNAKEAIKMLSAMPGNQMVKITIIK